MASISLKYKSKQGNLTAPGDVDPGAMIPIATVTGTGSSPTITFSNIPLAYEHLQVRFIGMTTRTTYGIDSMNIAFNGVGGTSYSRHDIRADGSSVSAGSSVNGASIDIGYSALGTTVSNYPGIGIVDILDYSNTNKFKTVKYIGGVDLNGSIAGFPGAIIPASGLFRSTDAITSITFTAVLGNFSSTSTFALYGIKRAGA